MEVLQGIEEARVLILSGRERKRERERERENRERRLRKKNGFRNENFGVAENC